MSRVMAWDPHFGGPHGRAMKRAMAPASSRAARRRCGRRRQRRQRLHLLSRGAHCSREAAGDDRRRPVVRGGLRGGHHQRAQRRRRRSRRRAMAQVEPETAPAEVRTVFADIRAFYGTGTRSPTFWAARSRRRSVSSPTTPAISPTSGLREAGLHGPPVEPPPQGGAGVRGLADDALGVRHRLPPGRDASPRWASAGFMEVVGVTQMFSSYTKIADTLQLWSTWRTSPRDPSGVRIRRGLSGADEHRRARARDRAVARAYRQQIAGDLERAIETYRRSIATCPPRGAHVSRLDVLVQGRLEEATAECLRAIEVDPDFGNPYNDIGVYLMQQASSRRPSPGSSAPSSGALRAAAVSVHEPRRIYLKQGAGGSATPVRGRRSSGPRRRRPCQDPAFLARSPELTRRTLGTMRTLAEPRGCRGARCAGAGSSQARVGTGRRGRRSCRLPACSPKPSPTPQPSTSTSAATLAGVTALVVEDNGDSRDSSPSRCSVAAPPCTSQARCRRLSTPPPAPLPTSSSATCPCPMPTATRSCGAGRQRSTAVDRCGDRLPGQLFPRPLPGGRLRRLPHEARGSGRVV